MASIEIEDDQIGPAMIRTALDQARQAALQIDDLRAANARTILTLETVVEHPFEGPVKASFKPQRRTEIRSRIEANPELRTFILARIATRTFDQVLAEVQAHFPTTCHLSRSALHRWWHRYGTCIDQAQPPNISRS